MIIRVSFYIVFGVFFVSASGLNTVKRGTNKYPEELMRGDIWPQPQYVNRSRHYFSLAYPQQFKVTMSGETCELLTAIVEKFLSHMENRHNYFMRHHQTTATTSNKHNDTFYRGPITHLDIHLKEPCDNDMYPNLGMDESYETIIGRRSITYITSVWAANRALNSYNQAFYYKDNKLYTDVSHIIDYPRYPHRGLLIDTSRHHISLLNIKKILDAMWVNNLNVLHWHIVDDQSFPYQSEVFPDLSEKGAYHSTLTYSKADIKQVVEYARQNAIRVVPEFDVPGHTRSWGNAFPDILTKCYSDGKMVGLGPMDPTKNTTYEVLETVIKEVQEWFPEKYLHIGGDEVDLECWSSNPDVKKYMKEHNMTVNQLHALFVEKVLPLFGIRSKPIVWQEVFDEGVPLSSDTIVQVWKGGSVDEMVRILEAGHRLIFSSSWYLDQLDNANNWLDFYNVDPREMVIKKLGNTSLALLENIVGGEACMWGEVVDDTNIISRIWPRASAVGERLWSALVDNTGLSDRKPLGRHTKPGAERPRETLDELYKRMESNVCYLRDYRVYGTPPNGPGYCIYDNFHDT